MNILIGGGRGLIGKALSSSLQTSGHTVKIITRLPKSSSEISWGDIESAGLPKDTHIVINVSGRSIGEVNPSFLLPSNYKSYLNEVYSSRIDTTKKLVAASHSVPLKAFINASAIGFYPPDLSKKFTEDEQYRDCGFITRLVKDWEAAAQMPDRVDVRQLQLRFGVVLAKDSSFIKALYPTHRIGLGGRVGSGRQWISWIHLDDVTRIVEFLLKPDCPVLSGPVNATAPVACRQAAFATALGEALHAPTLPFGPPPTPSLVAKLLMGPDRATLMLDGQRVIPKKLLDAGFTFKYPKLEDALAAIFGRRPSPVVTE